MKRLIAAVFALACVMTLARAAHADQGTLFGVGDDLSVMGTSGTYDDADVEIFGLTVLGPTPTTGVRLDAGAGNNQGSIYVGKDIQVVGKAFLPNVADIIPLDLSGNGSKVLRVNSGGTALEYGSVSSLLDTGVGLNTVPYWTGTTYAGSAISQVDSLVTVSSNTRITANLDVDGTLNADSYATFGASVTVNSTLAVSSNTHILADLDVDGRLNVDSYSTFGASVTVNSTLYVSSTAQLGGSIANGGVGINTAPDADNKGALTVLGTGTATKYIATFYSGDGSKLAAWIQNK